MRYRYDVPAEFPDAGNSSAFAQEASRLQPEEGENISDTVVRWITRIMFGGLTLGVFCAGFVAGAAVMALAA